MKGETGDQPLSLDAAEIGFKRAKNGSWFLGNFANFFHFIFTILSQSDTCLAAFCYIVTIRTSQSTVGLAGLWSFGWIMVHQRYQWIFAQTGFTGSFDWCTMIRVILDHWSYLGSYQRNTPYIHGTDLINAHLHCFCRPTGGSTFFGAGRYKPDQLTEAVGTSLFNISWSTNWFVVQICN